MVVYVYVYVCLQGGTRISYILRVCLYLCLFLVLCNEMLCSLV